MLQYLWCDTLKTNQPSMYSANVFKNSKAKKIVLEISLGINKKQCGKSCLGLRK